MTSYQSTKQRLHEILEKAKPGDTTSRVFDDFLMALIVLNVGAVIFATVQDFPPFIYTLFNIFEVFSVAIFTVEYFLRAWTCTVDSRYKGHFLGRFKYLMTPLAIIDLLAILPFYFPFFIPFDLRELRSLRLFKFFRLFKFGRYLESIHTFANVIKRKREQFVLTFCLLSMLLIISSSVMYFAEHEAQPDAFSSIPAAMWWGIITLTTIGYGDVYPITVLGKVLATFIAMLGIGTFAIPVAVLGSGFMEEAEHKKSLMRHCPHCGWSLRKETDVYGKKQP